MITITRGPEGKSAPGPVMAVGGPVSVLPRCLRLNDSFEVWVNLGLEFVRVRG